MHPVSFIRGALFGAFVMYLFAPRSGAESRRMLAQRGEDIKNSLNDLASNVTDEITSSHAVTSDEVLPLPGSNAYRPMTYQQQ